MVEKELRVIGQRVRLLRAQKRWTQEECARRCNLSPQYIRDLENFRRVPSIRILFQLARGFDVEPTVFLKKIGGDE